MNASRVAYRQFVQLASRLRDGGEHALPLRQRVSVHLQVRVLEREQLRFVRQRLGSRRQTRQSVSQKRRRLFRCVLESSDRAVRPFLPLRTLAVKAHAVRVVVELCEYVKVRGWKRARADTHVIRVAGRNGAS